MPSISRRLISMGPLRFPFCKNASAVRWASSTSRWKQRQGRDAYARDAKVQGLKSRAAFKLLEVQDITKRRECRPVLICPQMDAKFRVFKGNGQTVVDLVSLPLKR